MQEDEDEEEEKKAQAQAQTKRLLKGSISISISLVSRAHHSRPISAISKWMPPSHVCNMQLSVFVPFPFAFQLPQAGNA